MSNAKLYGVGVGPGAPDLMTLRAQNVLSSVDVLAIPRPNAWSASLAWRIAKGNIPERDDQEKLFLTFPMSKDPDVLKPHWDAAFEEINKRLQEGLTVAFITQGDPMVYSTFIYLYSHAQEYWPDVPVEIVPGVSSINAVPSCSGIPLVDGQENLAVIPASYYGEKIVPVLREFDAVVLMKVSSILPQVISILEEEGLLDHAVYIERATSKEEKIVRDLRNFKQDKCVYFSMIIVNKKHRSGLLQGRVKHAN